MATFLVRPDDQFSSDLLRRARDHLVAHFDDPLVALPEDDPALGALVTDVALAAQERPPTDELVLRMSILQLEQRRIERETSGARRRTATMPGRPTLRPRSRGCFRNSGP